MSPLIAFHPTKGMSVRRPLASFQVDLSDAHSTGGKQGGAAARLSGVIRNRGGVQFVPLMETADLLQKGH